MSKFSNTIQLNQGLQTMHIYYMVMNSTHLTLKLTYKDTWDREKLLLKQVCVLNTGMLRVKKKHHSKVLLNSFSMNGHTLRFCP